MSEITNDDIIIEFADLQTATDDCFIHSRNLLKTAKKNYENNEFKASIVFSIIAFEEFGKTVKFSEYLLKRKGIPRKEMKKLNCHNYKSQIVINRYTSVINDIKNNEEFENELSRDTNLKLDVTTKSLTSLRQSMAKSKEFLKYLSIIKEMILYFDFKLGSPISFSNQISENNIECLAHFLVEFVSFIMNYEFTVFLAQTNGFTPSKDIPTIEDTATWIECKNYVERSKQSDYRIIQTKASLIISELKQLDDYLIENDLKIR